MDSVALIKDRNGIRNSLEEGLKLLGGFRSLRSPVLIKPNICTMNDGTGHSVTDIAVIKGLVDLIVESDDSLSIKIIESDSQSKNAEDAFDKFGYKEYCSEMKNLGFNISTLNLSRVPIAKIDFDGQYFKNPELPDVLTKSHYFISVAVAKTHYLSYITGVLKNLFGVLPRKDMSFYHSRIHDVITDLARIIRPELNIVDARVGVEDWDGPTTHAIGAFILGKQPVSVDATMVQIMGLDPLEVRHLVHCRNHDLGNFHPAVVGESIESMKVKFNSPR